jgi:hypothetical protein
MNMNKFANKTRRNVNERAMARKKKIAGRQGNNYYSLEAQQGNT